MYPVSHSKSLVFKSVKDFVTRDGIEPSCFGGDMTVAHQENIASVKANPEERQTSGYKTKKNKQKTTDSHMN
jgi:hypothetical protein